MSAPFSARDFICTRLWAFEETDVVQRSTSVSTSRIHGGTGLEKALNTLYGAIRYCKV